MAKQRYGINDAYQGTVGTVIGYEWRGKWCLRARPRMVRNPRTEAQQVNREVFKCVVREDEVYLAAYCPELGEVTMSGSVWRKKGRVDLSLPPCWQDKAVELWLFAVDYRGRASRSVYVGELSSLAAGEESAGGVDVLAARGAEGADNAVAVQEVLEGADGAGRGGLVGGAGRGVEADEVDAAVESPQGLGEACGVGQVVVEAAEHGVLEREAPLAAPVVLSQQGEDLAEGECLLHGHDGQALLRHGVVEADGEVALALLDEALQAGDDAHGGDGDALGAPAQAPVGGEDAADGQDGVEVVHGFAHAHEDNVGELLELGDGEELVEDVARRQRAVESLLPGDAEAAAHLAAHLA